MWLAQGKPYAERTWNCFRFLIFVSFSCASLSILLACRHPSQACVSVPGRVMLVLQGPRPRHTPHLPSAPQGVHPPTSGWQLWLPNCFPPSVCAPWPVRTPHSGQRVCLRRAWVRSPPRLRVVRVPSRPARTDSLPWPAGPCIPGSLPASLLFLTTATLTLLAPRSSAHPATGPLHLLSTFPDVHTALLSASLQSHFSGHHKDDFPDSSVRVATLFLCHP